MSQLWGSETSSAIPGYTYVGDLPVFQLTGIRKAEMGQTGPQCFGTVAVLCLTPPVQSLIFSTDDYCHSDRQNTI
jgi:hypothetical protein